MEDEDDDNADNDDPKTAPTPERPDDDEWPRLLRILYGTSTGLNSAEEGWKWVYKATRKLVRDFALHVHIERTLMNGILWVNLPLEERPIVKASQYDDVVEDEGIFNLILNAFPNLEASLHALRRSPSLIKTLADFITKVNAKVRSDDLVHVNRHIVEALELDLKSNQKHHRGFKNTETGHLLCPIDKLEEFDRDPEAFCQGVIDADPDDDHYQLLAVDWPLAIYRESSFDHSEKLKGLLQSTCCLKVFQIIYLGPAAAIPGYCKGNRGQQSIAKKYGIRKATIENIVRSAAIARFALTSTTEWTNRDINFDSPNFVRTLLNAAFLNPTYMDKLIEWYTTHVFGNGKSEAAMRRCIENSAYGHFMKQKQELECIPGAWYHYRLGLIADIGNPSEDRDGHHPTRSAPGGGDELEYLDKPATPVASPHHNERKRKRVDEDVDTSGDHNGEYSEDSDHERGQVGQGSGGGRHESEDTENPGSESGDHGEHEV